MRQSKLANKMAFPFYDGYAAQSEKSFRKQRVFRDRTNPLEAYDDREFFDRFRIRKEEMLTLHEELKSKLEYPQPRKGALPAILQLVIAVRFYACGSFLGVIGDIHGVSKATAWKTLHRVTGIFRSLNRS